MTFAAPKSSDQNAQFKRASKRALSAPAALRHVLLMASVAGLLACPAVAGDAASEILYGATRNGGGISTSYLFTIDPDTGTQQQIGDIGYSINGLAWDPVGKTLIGSISYTDSAAPQLLRIDPVTGAGTPMFAAQPDSTTLWVNTVTVRPDGSIYAWGIESDDAVLIDRDTGEMTALQDSGVAAWGHSFASDRDGNLFLVTGSQWVSGPSVPAPAAYSIDPDTGAATLLGSMDGLVPFGTTYIEGLARHGSFGDDNHLYTLGGIAPWTSGTRTLQIIDMTTLETLSTMPIDGLNYLHVLAWGGWAALAQGLDAGLSYQTALQLAISTAQAAQDRNLAVAGTMSRELTVKTASNPAGSSNRVGLSSMGGAGIRATALRVEGAFSDATDQGGSGVASLMAAIEIVPGVDVGAFVTMGTTTPTDSAVSATGKQLGIGGYMRINPQAQGFTWKAMAAASGGSALLTRSGASGDLDAGLVENGSGSADIDTRAFGVEIGHRFITQHGAVIMPYAGLTVAQTTRSAYAETGGTTSPLSYDAATFEQSILTLGITADYRLTNRAMLHMKGGIAHDLQTAAQTMTGTSAITGLEVFSANVPETGTDHAFLGLGLSVNVGTSSSLTLDVDVQKNADQGDSVQTLRAGYEVRF